MDMQVASLGAVVLHELGHAIRVGEWYFDVPDLDSVDVAAIREFENCITRDLVTSGSVRPNMTANENWADAIGYRFLASDILAFQPYLSSFSQ